MSGEKGTMHYPASIKAELVAKHQMGQSVKSLSKECNVVKPTGIGGLQYGYGEKRNLWLIIRRY